MSAKLRKILENLFAEFLATFFVVSLTCMGCIDMGIQPKSTFQTSINVAFAVVIGVQCFDGISGAHFNPVVTVAAVVHDLLSASMAIVYFMGQLMGAIMAYGFVQLIVKSEKDFCMTLPAESLSSTQAFFVEFVITGIFITVCCSVWDPRNLRYKDSVAIKMGLTVGGCVLAAGSLSGGSMNPARSFAPALWQNNFDKQWIYWVSPISSSLITSLFYKYAFRQSVSWKIIVNKWSGV